MSTSFIDYNGKGYWIPDGFIEVVSWFLYLELENVNDPQIWIEEIKNNFYEISQERYPGWNTFLFDEYLTDEDRRSFFSCLIDSCISNIRKKGSVIEINELNSINRENVSQGGRWTEDLAVSKMINLLLDIKKIIHNEGGYGVGDPVKYSW